MSILVLFDSAGLVALEYLHDRIAKKNEPIIRLDVAIDIMSFDDHEYSL
jgi:hypothetical protein